MLPFSDGAPGGDRGVRIVRALLKFLFPTASAIS
jgi:hypothetical protein